MQDYLLYLPSLIVAFGTGCVLFLHVNRLVIQKHFAKGFLNIEESIRNPGQLNFKQRALWAQQVLVNHDYEASLKFIGGEIRLMIELEGAQVLVESYSDTNAFELGWQGASRRV